ncbi:MAG: hypothetical protein JOZ25_10245 [Actinobacteria bacterium]|nr:hypothetical protein [Actinomycetota bacterium]
MDEDRTAPPEDDPAADAGRNLPVLASEARPIEPAAETALAAPAVAAAGGFLAGLVTLVIVRALRARPRRGLVLRRRRRQNPAERALEIAASRSFLVDVHVVKR